MFHDKKSVGASVSSFFDGVIETLLINSTFAPFADHWCLAAPIVIDEEIYAALLFVAAEQFSKPQEASCLDFAEECRSSVAGLFEEQRLNVEIEQMTDRLMHIQTNDPLGLTQRNGARSNGPRSFGDIRLSLDTQTARRGNRELNLTHREFDLLDTFLRSPGIALSRIQIVSRVWIERNGISSNVLNVTVKNLRGKLEAEGEPRVIHALRAYGYVLKA